MELFHTIMVVVLGFVFVYLSYCDIRTRTIPNSAIISLLAIATIYHMYVGFKDIACGLLGALIISIPMFLLSFGKRRAFGGGDIKLVAVSGFLLGVAQIIVAFFLSILSAACYVTVCMALGRKNKKDTIAFGPFLCLGIMVAIIVGDRIVRWYVG